MLVCFLFFLVCVLLFCLVSLWVPVPFFPVFVCFCDFGVPLGFYGTFPAVCLLVSKGESWCGFCSVGFVQVFVGLCLFFFFRFCLAGFTKKAPKTRNRIVYGSEGCYPQDSSLCEKFDGEEDCSILSFKWKGPILLEWDWSSSKVQAAAKAFLLHWLFLSILRVPCFGP